MTDRSREFLHLVEAPEVATASGADLTLPMVLNVDDTCSPADVMGMLALRPFTAGEQPWSRSARLSHVRPEAPLRPENGRVLRQSRDDNRETTLVEGEGWTLLASRWKPSYGHVAVSAESEELAETVLADSVRDATDPPKTDETNVEMGFWHMGPNGPVRTERAISADSWDQIRTNYTGSVATALDDVMALKPDDVTGRLLLLHGPPGTGKTTALRSLARSWSSWCQADCVLDPESLFGTPSYLMEAVVGGDEDEEERRWRLLILEDCDELIRGEAKATTGQGLSRLLNLTDGMLGQGRDVLVAITTNEDLTRLHPAIVRPGRCLAQVQVGSLTRSESLAWLDDPDADITEDGATLAELVARRRGETAPAASAAQSQSATGFYL